MTFRYSTDIAIFGGGVAGLWLLKRLRAEGYQAILLESSSIGGGQTLASQGIIHGGLKYALSGTLTQAATTIAGMPKRWRRCLAGEDPVDISDVKVLQEHYYMWSEASFRSRLKTFLGSKSLVGKVIQVKPENYPDFFANSVAKGSLYQLPDFVIDTSTLLGSLTNGMEDNLFLIEPSRIRFEFGANDECKGFQLGSGDTQATVEAQRLVFCAGEGNESLISNAGLTKVRSQTRPLNMVYLKKKGLPEVFVHCIGDDFGLSPRLTITSHTANDGVTVWYLGGELAETGVDKNESDQLKAAKIQLAKYFPWLDISDAEWGCFAINRAEADINNNYRPDGAYISEEKNIIAAWPTKLTLTPALGDILVEQLNGITKSADSDTLRMRELFPQPPLGQARWD